MNEYMTQYCNIKDPEQQRILKNIINEWKAQ